MAERIGIIGNVSPYDEQSDDFDVWTEVFELYCVANEITVEKKQSVFLTLIGINLYKILRALATPVKPKDLSFDRSVELLREHLKIMPSVTAERSKFRSCLQKENQTVGQFMLELQKLSENCQFGANLEEALRDQIVHGLYDQNLKKKLFREPDLNYQKTLSIIRAWESARISLDAEGKINESGVNFVRDRKVKNKIVENLNREEIKCTCCGYDNHVFRDCKFKNYTCNICDRKGHLAKVCFKNKVKKENNSNNATKSNVHKIGDNKNNVSGNTSDEEELFLGSLFCISETKNENAQSKPSFINVQINGKDFQMEIDNGSGISVISYKLYKQEFSNIQITSNRRQFMAYLLI